MVRMAAEANLDDYARRLADALEAAIPAWVVRSVEGRWREWTGTPLNAELHDAARAAGERARDDVGTAVRALLALDVDEQRVNPLAIVRRAVSYPTEVLRAAGVPPIVRDDFEERAFPDDVYGLSPASFADIDASVHDPGIAWGAAKAHTHLSRRRG